MSHFTHEQTGTRGEGKKSPPLLSFTAYSLRSSFFFLLYLLDRLESRCLGECSLEQEHEFYFSREGESEVNQ